jgi:tetratricopeptide (TPR) repeat protein
MSPRLLILLAALAASLAAAPAHAAPDREAVQASERELRAGLTAYEAADYAVAIEHFERAYALHPSPQYLYAWAQAARSAGDCAAAVDLYQRFIASGATGASLQAAQQNETRCREQLAEAAQADAAAEASAPPEPTPVEPPIVADAPTEPARPRRRPDGLGIALVATGGAALGTGAALLAIASARRTTQDAATDYDRFDALDRQILRLDVAGGATLGVGAALAIAGVIRLATKARRNRADPRQARLVIPTIDARGTPLLLLRIPLR